MVWTTCVVKLYTLFVVGLLFIPTSGEMDGRIIHSWLGADYDWPSKTYKDQNIINGNFVFEHNMISGIKSYGKDLYVSVPRLKYPNGVPSTLNKIVWKDNKYSLQPFPNWVFQNQSDCKRLQCAMSFEIDPINGHMYVIDSGRLDVYGDVENTNKQKPCGGKLMVFDIKKKSLIRFHTFPDKVVPRKTNFLNDLVLDRGSRTSSKMRWVYITDAAEGVLYTFDLKTNVTKRYDHPSMKPDDKESNMTIQGKVYRFEMPIKGIALSGSTNYLYYCPLGSKKLYQVPTNTLRSPEKHPFATAVRLVGSKISQTEGMICSVDKLYFSAVTEDAVYRWPIEKDMKSQAVPEGKVMMKTQEMVVQSSKDCIYPDSFGISQSGKLYFTACKAHLFLKNKMDFSGKSGDNFKIWEVDIGENSYLQPSSEPSQHYSVSGCIIVKSSRQAFFLLFFYIGCLYLT